jgi:hypothetical protein
MTQPYAKGKYAFGFCDRCGFRYDLGDLKFEVRKGRNVNLKVCNECWDPDQPQLWLGTFPVNDPQALRDPRPDIAQTQSRALFGWIPVDSIIDAAEGNEAGEVGNNAVYISGLLGQVIILTNGKYTPDI